MTSLRQDPSAHAPWTRTMFGRPFICGSPFVGPRRRKCEWARGRRASHDLAICKVLEEPQTCSLGGAHADSSRAGVSQA
jgi:hypothetical protein